MRKAFIIILTLLNVSAIYAQRNEIGPFIGASYYLGDLNPSKHFMLSRPAAGLIYRYNFDHRWALKMSGLYGSVAGDDSKARFNQARNLSFKSPVAELSSQLELNFLPYLTGNTDKEYFTPYIFGGISVFRFNPKASYDGHWYKLQPLGTEGQGTSLYGTKPYSLVNISFPFGFGFKYSVGKYVCIGTEWGLRKTTTDYLDDVSKTYSDPKVLSTQNNSIAIILADRSGKENNTGMQRGNSGTKDWYSFAGAFITFKFKTGGKESCPAYK